MPIAISVVIPAYNEARYLPQLLGDIAAARQRYRLGEDAVEVVLADNGSTDATVTIAHQFGCRVVPVVSRRIGAVRNGGARAAQGRLLAFVDADTRIHPDTFNAIDNFFADGTKIFGSTGVLAERRSIGIDLTWLGFTLGTALLGFGIPHHRYQCAATGLVCCHHPDWAAVDGYSERLRFAEDVVFLLDMKRLGRTQHRSVGWLRDVPAVFSARKFDQYGDWHYIIMPLRFLLAIVWYPTLRRWADRYWYGRQRES